jgi:uncharacterized protein YkwD
MTARRLLFLLLAGALACLAGDESRYEREVFEAINRERAAHGAKPLVWNDAVAKQARAHSARMDARQFFSHQDPEFGGVGERLKRGGVRWRACAENVHQQKGFADPVKVAVEGWMNSLGHRRNLLDPQFVRTGVGIVRGRGGTYYFTQIFVRP